MERFERAAIVSTLLRSLRAQGSWCGETHVQKATYLLQDLCSVPIGYEFVLYKHGPFAFDLRDELNDFRGYGLVALQPSENGFRPRFMETESAARNEDRHRALVSQHARAIEFIASEIGAKGVVDLERVSTALLLTREMAPDASVIDRATRLNAIKPHILIENAIEAVTSADQLIRVATESGLTAGQPGAEPPQAPLP